LILSEFQATNIHPPSTKDVYQQHAKDIYSYSKCEMGRVPPQPTRSFGQLQEVYCNDYGQGAVFEQLGVGSSTYDQQRYGSLNDSQRPDGSSNDQLGAYSVLHPKCPSFDEQGKRPKDLEKRCLQGEQFVSSLSDLNQPSQQNGKTLIIA
jgi:hypothetical protein